MRYLRLFSVYHQKHEKKTDNSPIRVNANKTERRILFRIKKGYYLLLLMPETMKALKVR